jgi:hypothetical protein
MTNSDVDRTQRSIPQFSLKARVVRLFNRPVLLGLIVVPIAYTLTGIWVLVQHTNSPVKPINEAVQVDRWTRPDSIKTELKSTLEANPELTSVIIDASIARTTIFSSITVRGQATRGNNGDISYRFSNGYEFETADFVALTGIWLVLVYLYIQGADAVAKLAGTVKGFRIPIPRANPPQYEAAPPALRPVALDEIQTISQDISHNRKRADEIFYRSTIVLIGGVAMAFIGVAVFYFSVREVRGDIGGGALAIEILRPGAMLLFLEAVAWFLLNQYRLQSNDYRAYHDRLAKRTELLAAMHVLRGNGTNENREKLLSSLLAPLGETTLRTGETTPSLESERLSAANPMFDVVRDLIKKLPNVPQDNKKDA